MNKKHLLAAAVVSMAMFVSCTNSSSTLPENPKDKEEYKDQNGNTWVYNAALMYWMMRGASQAPNGGGTYYYYPNSGKFTNEAGATVTPPPSVASGIKSSVPSSSNNKPVFGSTGKSHSSAS